MNICLQVNDIPPMYLPYYFLKPNFIVHMCRAWGICARLWKVLQYARVAIFQPAGVSLAAWEDSISTLCCIGIQMAALWFYFKLLSLLKSDILELVIAGLNSPCSLTLTSGWSIYFSRRAYFKIGLIATWLDYSRCMHYFLNWVVLLKDLRRFSKFTAVVVTLSHPVSIREDIADCYVTFYRIQIYIRG